MQNRVAVVEVILRAAKFAVLHLANFGTLCETVFVLKKGEARPVEHFRPRRGTPFVPGSEFPGNSIF
jgi:hypothetical protein